MSELAESQWEHAKVLQTLHIADTEHGISRLIEPGALDAPSSEAQAEPEQQAPIPNNAERLEAIPEETSDVDSDTTALYTQLEAGLA